MKLSVAAILVLGISVAIIALSFAGFVYVMPNLTEAGYQREQRDLLQAELDKRPQAISRVEQAIETVQTEARSWQEIVARRTPPIGVDAGGIDLAVNRWQLTVDARRFRNNIQRAVNRQVRVGGVTVVNGPEVPPFSDSATNLVERDFNYPALPFPVVIFDFGTITVRGTLAQIFRNVEAWSEMPGYLAVTSGLRLAGTSPNITGTYSLSMLAYIRGDRIFPPVPEAAGAAPGGIGAGAGFGPGAPMGGPFGPGAPMGGPFGPPGAGRPGAPMGPGAAAAAGAGAGDMDRI